MAVLMGVWVISKDNEILGVTEESHMAFSVISNLLYQDYKNNDQAQEILSNSFSMNEDSFGCLEYHAAYVPFL